MRLATVKIEDLEQTAILTPAGYIPLAGVNQRFSLNCPTDLLALIESGRLSDLKNWFDKADKERLAQIASETPAGERLPIAPLYRQPPKIWGIGLNYVEHAADLDEKAPKGIPGSFMKPATTVIGPGDTIWIPRQSERTTAEGELGVIIGQTCRDVPQENWRDVVAGFTTIIDMTAEDILRQNPRYLTVAKSFDTFFSFGPELVTPDEIEDVSNLRVATVINGRVHAQNTVSNMTFSPAFLVSFLSSVMTLLPGDIISTGTPGATPIKDGDVVACRITGFAPLVNPVRDLKMAHRGDAKNAG